MTLKRSASGSATPQKDGQCKHVWGCGCEAPIGAWRCSSGGKGIGKTRGSGPQIYLRTWRRPRARRRAGDFQCCRDGSRLAPDQSLGVRKRRIRALESARAVQTTGRVWRLRREGGLLSWNTAALQSANLDGWHDEPKRRRRVTGYCLTPTRTPRVRRVQACGVGRGLELEGRRR